MMKFLFVFNIAMIAANVLYGMNYGVTSLTVAAIICHLVAASASGMSVWLVHRERV